MSSCNRFVVSLFVAASAASAASASIVSISQTFFNSTAAARTYQYQLYAQVANSMTNGLMSGGISATLTDLNGNGAQMTATGANAVYTASVNDVTAETLWNAPFNFSVGQFLSNSTTPARFEGLALPPGMPSDGIMAITLRFTLSAGDAVSISSTFSVVPAPGAAAFFGLAGIGASRKRRRL